MVTAALLSSRSPTILVPNEVYWSGAQREVIHGGDLSAHAWLSELHVNKSLYAVGPHAGLVGELTVIDSHPYVATVESKSPKVMEDWSACACFLVYASVPKWRKSKLSKTSATLFELESSLPRLARAAGIDTLKPFPFMLEGQVTRLAYHILNRSEDLPHNEERHEAIKVRFQLKNGRIRAVGFYSQSHAGVFIPSGKRVHIHFVSTTLRASGHVDAMAFGPDVTLALPG